MTADAEHVSLGILPPSSYTTVESVEGFMCLGHVLRVTDVLVQSP